jgi:hypothetical protein
VELIRELTPVEARVLAVLVEKQHTVPDSYPLSLNTLTLGCNQKTAREPVMSLAEAEVLAALNALKDLSLVFEVSGSRVTRFEHNFKRVYGIPGQAEALLTVLLLRGPQTVAELRLNAERLHRFADLSSVEGFLNELAARETPLARLLPKAPGAREPRWVSLLCGAPDISTQASAPAPGGRSELADEVAALRLELDALKAEVAQLRQAFEEGA